MRTRFLFFLSFLFFTAGCRDSFLAPDRQLAATHSRIFYTSMVIKGATALLTTIYSIAHDNSIPQRITNGGTDILSSSPRAGKIAYLHPDTPDNIVYVADADGTNPLVLDIIPSFTTVLPHVELSPDGKNIAYVTTDVKTGTVLCIAKTDGTVLHIPVVMAGPLVTLSFSPNSQFIAVSFFSGDIQIFDIQGAYHFSFGNSVYTMAWSPIGNRLVYVQGSGSTVPYIDYDGTAFSLSDTCSVMLADVDGQHPQTIMKDTAQIFDIAWSPDGQKIALCRSRMHHVLPFSTDIWTMNMDGSNQKNCTGEYRKTDVSRRRVNPQWSPDGRQIVFRDYDRGTTSLYSNLLLMDTDLSTIIPLVQDAYGGYWER